jgi:hypothetical protein
MAGASWLGNVNFGAAVPSAGGAGASAANEAMDNKSMAASDAMVFISW